MVNFTYYTPTKVLFGKDTQAETGKLAKEFGATKVLLHYGSSRVVESGLLASIEASLSAQGIASVTLGGVVPNPHVELVYQGVALCRAEKVDFIIAIGGGSVIDSAKAIAYGVPYDGDVWDFYSGKQAPQAALPLGCVLTVAAAGSEMSNSSVITNEKTGEKRGCNQDISRPKFAVMNPELTLSLPAYPTACGVADILMHTIERYFGAEENMGVTVGMAEALLRTVMLNGRLLTRKPQSYQARAEVMWANSLSHNGLTGCGGTGDWAVHQLGHEISGRYDTAHGASLTAIWASWARYVYKQDPARFAQFAVNVLEIEDTGDDIQVALAGIEEMESYFWALELPTSFADLDIDITEEIAAELAKGCSRNGTRTVGGLQALNEQDMKNIYLMAK